MKIKYRFADRSINEIEAKDSVGEVIVAKERDIHNSNRKETRRHESYSGDNEKMNTFIKTLLISCHIMPQVCRQAISKGLQSFHKSFTVVITETISKIKRK